MVNLMNDQVKILILSFIIALVVICIAPDTESAMISITVIWGFLSINNSMYEYKKNAKELKEPDVENKSEQFVIEKANLVGDINDSSLDTESFVEELNDDDILDEYTEQFTDSRAGAQSQPSERTSGNTYDPDGEYTPDKVGYMRHDMERRNRQHESYTRCYKPLKSNTNDCDLYANMPIDEQMTGYWRERGLRNKKMKDGIGSKTAEYYKTHFNTELDISEKKVWWENEDNF